MRKIEIELNAAIAQAHSLMEEGDLPGAADLYHRIHKVNPALGASGLGKVAMARKDFQAARDHFAQATQLDPSDPEAACLLGAAYYHLGDYDNGFDWVERAFQKGVELPDIRYYRGLILNGIGRNLEAEVEMRIAVSARPDLPRYQHGLGVVLLEGEGKVDDAIDHLLEAIRLKIDYFDAYPDLVEAFVMAGRTDELVSRLEGVSDSVRSPSVFRSLVDAAVRAKMSEVARRGLDWLVDNLSDDRDAHEEVATWYAKLGDYDEAIFHLKRAVEIDPEDWKAWFSLGTVQLRSGRLDDAQESFERSLIVNPNQWESYNGRAVVALKNGRWQYARENLDVAVARNPRDPAVLLNAAIAYRNIEDLTQAKALAKDAMEYSGKKTELRAQIESLLAELQ